MSRMSLSAAEPVHDDCRMDPTLIRRLMLATDLAAVSQHAADHAIGVRLAVGKPLIRER